MALENKIKIYDFPPLILTWPLLAAGYLLFPLDAWHIVSNEALGIFYTGLSFFVIITLGGDLKRGLFFITFLLLLVLYLILAMVFGNKGLFEAVGWVYTSIDFEYGRRSAFLLSILLTAAWASMLTYTRLSSVWILSESEWEHISFAERIEAFEASGAYQKVEEVYPDWLELILGGFGTIILKDSRSQKVLAEIRHVPFAHWKKRKANDFLSHRCKREERFRDSVPIDTY